MPTIHVHHSPVALAGVDLARDVAVVIDLLRASTTITHALAAGAAAIIPCKSIEEARDRAGAMPEGSFLLGGERHGVRIHGFHLGNSPTEYTPAVVSGKSLVFTTTNGTIALHRASPARRVLVGCLANLSSVAAAAAELQRPVHLVCAGIQGEPCSEDSLCAGAIAERLGALGFAPGGPDAQAAIAAWRSISPSAPREALYRSEGGRNLVSAGLEADISVCAEVDVTTVVPDWDHARGILRTAVSRGTV